MALSSSSTNTDAVNQLKDSLGYRRSGSVALAQDLIEACEWLLAMRPAAASEGNVAATWSPQQLAEMSARAEAFVRSSAHVDKGGAGVVYLDTSGGF